MTGRSSELRGVPAGELEAVRVAVHRSGSIGLTAREVAAEVHLSSLAVIPALEQLLADGLIQRESVPGQNGSVRWRYRSTALGQRSRRAR